FLTATMLPTLRCSWWKVCKYHWMVRMGRRPIGAEDHQECDQLDPQTLTAGQYSDLRGTWDDASATPGAPSFNIDLLNDLCWHRLELDHLARPLDTSASQRCRTMCSAPGRG